MSRRQFRERETPALFSMTDSTGTALVRHTPVADVVIDVAGASMGGAASYLACLDKFLQQLPPSHGVNVIGRGRRLGLSWLAHREWERRGALRTIAANNISFGSGPERIVLLRNALHFLSDDDVSRIGRPDARTEATARLVRAMARRADVVVVPSRAMRDRVLRPNPGLRDRVVIMNHPVEPPAVPRRPRQAVLRLLCPVLDAPYKALARRLSALTTEVASREDVELRLTTKAEWAQPCRNVVALGRLNADELSVQMNEADGIVFPLSIESFGFPMAEGRLRRIPVIAPPGELSEEIAGDAHVPCDFSDVDSIRVAIADAWSKNLPVLKENPFDPDRYFRTLFWSKFRTI